MFDMGIISGFRKGFVRIFALHPTKWIDYQNLKHTTFYLFNLGKTLYTIEQASRTETFEQALERLHITPEALELQLRNFSYLLYFFLALSLGIFCYFLWLLLHENWMGSCMSFAVMVYSLSLAFRYHFWKYQIQSRKLGCTFREWLNDLRGKSFKKGEVT